jgi:hypothetical protein
MKGKIIKFKCNYRKVRSKLLNIWNRRSKPKKMKKYLLNSNKKSKERLFKLRSRLTN